MYNPAERAEKIRKAIEEKRKDKEYQKKQKEANKRNAKKRWEKDERTEPKPI